MNPASPESRTTGSGELRARWARELETCFLRDRKTRECPLLLQQGATRHIHCAPQPGAAGYT
eukprot:9421784-Pyramimonas_sp.AAC.1